MRTVRMALMALFMAVRCTPTGAESVGEVNSVFRWPGRDDRIVVEDLRRSRGPGRDLLCLARQDRWCQRV
jgi:catabolite regulation protein CreA